MVDQTGKDEDPWAGVMRALKADASDDEVGNEVVASSDESLLGQLRREMGEEHTPRDKAQKSEMVPDRGLKGSNLELDANGREFVEMLRGVANKYLDRAPEVVYHPGSAQEVITAEAFPDARTIFTDIDGEVEHDFLQHNIEVDSGIPGRKYEFYRADLHSFRLPDGQMADLVISMNVPTLTKEELDELVRVGGVIIEGDTREGKEWGFEHATSAMGSYSGYIPVEKLALSNDEIFFVYRRES